MVIMDKMAVGLMATATLTGLSLPNPGFAASPAGKNPNVIIILTDDMGYGDISCYNKNQIRTPNIVPPGSTTIGAEVKSRKICFLVWKSLISAGHAGSKARQLIQRGTRYIPCWKVP